MRGADLVEHTAHRRHLAERIGSARVDDVHDQVRARDLLQRGPKAWTGPQRGCTSRVCSPRRAPRELLRTKRVPFQRPVLASAPPEVLVTLPCARAVALEKAPEVRPYSRRR